MQICKSNFKEDTICGGRVLLYESFVKDEQMPSRRRNEGVKSLQDIKLMKETDLNDVRSHLPEVESGRV